MRCEFLLIQPDGEMKTYGVRAQWAENDGEFCREIPDVTGDRAAIESFIERINRCDVSSCHFQELVEDFLGELYSVR